MKKIIFPILVLILTFNSCTGDQRDDSILTDQQTKVEELINGKTSSNEEEKVSGGRVKRWYSPVKQQHFYSATINPPGSQPNTAQWQLESETNIGYFRTNGCYPCGMVSSYYNYYNGDLVLTRNDVEKNYLVNNGYTFLENVGNSQENSDSNYPIYRYYNSKKRDHFYTKDFSELGNGKLGYVYEGIGFYGSYDGGVF